jgi:hypothetical protein
MYLEGQAYVLLPDFEAISGNTLIFDVLMHSTKDCTWKICFQVFCFEIISALQKSYRHIAGNCCMPFTAIHRFF